MNRQQLQQLAVFVLLIAIGVVGRWMRPEWAFTPIAATALFAGRFFPNRWIALLVPVSVLTVSNLIEPAHRHNGVALVVLGAMMIPALLGGWLRRVTPGGWKGAAQWGVCLLAPSMLFFLLTNFAHWALLNDYPKSLLGLGECYAAGVPFYRSMLTGDLFYTSVLFGAAYLAGVQWPRREVAKAA